MYVLILNKIESPVPLWNIMFWSQRGSLKTACRLFKPEDNLASSFVFPEIMRFQTSFVKIGLENYLRTTVALLSRGAVNIGSMGSMTPTDFEKRVLEPIRIFGHLVF